VFRCATVIMYVDCYLHLTMRDRYGITPQKNIDKHWSRRDLGLSWHWKCWLRSSVLSFSVDFYVVTDVSEERIAFIFRVIWQIEAEVIHFSETSVTTYKTAWRYNPEVYNRHCAILLKIRKFREKKRIGEQWNQKAGFFNFIYIILG
jgi:integrase